MNPMAVATGLLEALQSTSGNFVVTDGVAPSCVQERELAKKMFASAAGLEILHQASKRSNT